MQHNLLFLLVQCMIIFNEYKYVHSFIGNGIRVVEEGEFPSVVCIKKGLVFQGMYIEGVKCTGTLITRSHVLTAEHCFLDLSERITLIMYGAVDVRECERLYAKWWISYDQWATKAGIRIQHRSNDISIVKLVSSVPERIRPMPLCPVTTNRLTGLDVVAVGCGYSEPDDFPTNIEATNLKTISNRDCHVKALELRDNVRPVPDKDLCTFRDPFVLMSTGDSGGPLLYGNYLLAVNRGTYPMIRGHYVESQFNYHVGIDYYRHYIEALLSL